VVIGSDGYYHPSFMVILALDTTTRAGSTALMRGAEVVDVQASDAARPQAERLPAELMALLDRHGLELPQIDIYAVATGPGSFTGLRIGIATMQGLALAQGKPLIGISALDALASTAGPRTEGLKTRGCVARVATWIDAWRGEVYAALYENGAEVMPPTVDAPAHLLPRLGTATLFVGDGAAVYADLITAAGGHVADPAAPPIAGAIATLASREAAAGRCPPPHAIRPLYVRRPDAEVAREAR
jgi:tRNA threonylcarbamoyladenosine biosynthesis protein TsaB